MGDLRAAIGRTTEPLNHITPIVSATVRGKKSNRVKVRGARARRPRTAQQVNAGEAKRIAKAYSTRKERRPYCVIGVSVYVDELAEIDEGAELAQMNRSQYLAAAARHFKAFLESEGQTCTIASGGCEAVSRG